MFIILDFWNQVDIIHELMLEMGPLMSKNQVQKVCALCGIPHLLRLGEGALQQALCKERGWSLTPASFSQTEEARDCASS